MGDAEVPAVEGSERVEALRRAGPRSGAVEIAENGPAGAGRGPAGAGGNPRLGLHIDDEDLAAAFEFLDLDNTGELSLDNLQTLLGSLYKNWTSKEFRLLLGGEPHFTLDSLRALLSDNELSGFDPAKEAFKVFDPVETGYMSTDVLKNVMESLGHGQITQDDLDAMVFAADIDADGRVSQEDFRQMLNFHRTRKAKDALPQED